MTTTKAAACACVAVGVDAVEVRISYGPIASVWEERSQLPVLSTIDPTAFFPLQSGEGMDRDSLAFSAADDAMVAAVLAANPRTIVVVRCPDVYLMVETAYTPVILNQLYGGQEVWTGVVPVGRRHERSGGPLPLPKRRPHSPTPPQLCRCSLAPPTRPHASQCTSPSTTWTCGSRLWEWVATPSSYAGVVQVCRLDDWKGDMPLAFFFVRDPGRMTTTSSRRLRRGLQVGYRWNDSQVSKEGLGELWRQWCEPRSYSLSTSPLTFGHGKSYLTFVVLRHARLWRRVIPRDATASLTVANRIKL